MKELNIINIKKLEDKNIELPDSGAVMILGGNNTGKSTVIQCIQNILLAKNFIPNPVTKGKESGSIEYTGKDTNGNAVIVHMDIQKDGSSTISCVHYDIEAKKNRKMSNVSAIRDLLGNYFPLSVHQVFSMLKYAEGRREFFEKYISKLLSKDELERIAFIDKEISTKETIQTRNNLFFKRRELTKRQTELEAIIANAESLTPPLYSQNALIAAKDEIERDLKKIEKTKDQQRGIEYAITWINKVTTEVDSMKSNIDFLHKSLGLENEYIDIIYEQLENELKILSKEKIDTSKLLEHVTLLKTKNEKATSMLAAWDAYNGAFDSIIRKKEELQEIINLIKGLTVEIEALRQERIQIIQSSNLPKGMTIDEEYNLYIKDTLFHDASISETMARMYIILILLHIAESNFIDIGDWSLYDEDNKNKIAELAKRYNCLMMGQYVTDDENVTVKVIE